MTAVTISSLNFTLTLQPGQTIPLLLHAVLHFVSSSNVIATNKVDIVLAKAWEIRRELQSKIHAHTAVGTNSEGSER